MQIDYNIIPHTTLAAIVRDEISNPAGGIVDFLNSILPHVEEAVVVDTGSADGTREVLEQMQGSYAHLRVYDKEWEGFMQSRNFSLSKVSTYYTLVLDADELIACEDIPTLSRHMKETAWSYYKFSFRFVRMDGTQEIVDCAMNPRIFKTEGANYVSTHNRMGAFENLENFRELAKQAPIEIKHFLPSEESLYNKSINWYCRGQFKTLSPTEHSKIYGWKELNPFRKNFK